MMVHSHLHMDTGYMSRTTHMVIIRIGNRHRRCGMEADEGEEEIRCYLPLLMHVRDVH